MKEKKIWRKILACLLLISMSFSNFSDAADASMSHSAVQEAQDAQTEDADKPAAKVQEATDAAQTPETENAFTDQAESEAAGSQEETSDTENGILQTPVDEEAQEPTEDADGLQQQPAVDENTIQKPAVDENAVNQPQEDMEASNQPEMEDSESGQVSEGVLLPESPQEDTEGKVDGAEDMEMPIPDEEPYIELDFTNNMTLEELTALPENQVGSTIWKDAVNLFPTFAKRGLGQADTKTWDCDVYYVNVEETERYFITRTDDFSLKYQVRFHASQDFMPDQVRIRVKKQPIVDRDNNPISYSQIAVPSADIVDAMENPDRKRPFAYREVTGEDGEAYLEFYNYLPIEAGLNAAWQVLYENLDIMNIPDMTFWDFSPLIAVDTAKREEGAEPWIPEYMLVNEANGLRGQTDSEIRIKSVTKRAYKKPDSKHHTPILYTLSQVRQFIDNPVDAAFLKTDETLGKETLNTQDWRFAVWEVTVRGNATQPWGLLLEETLPDGGRVVGYKERKLDTMSSAEYEPIIAQQAIEGGLAIAESRKRTWATNFYVVTAHPTALYPDGSQIENQIQVVGIPVQDMEFGETVQDTALAVCQYKDYKWYYPGGIVSIGKRGLGQKEYSGWLDVYRNFTKDEDEAEDYGGLEFSSVGSIQDYGYTHLQEGSEKGEYIPGRRVKMTMADDVMYARTVDKDLHMLDSDDYYFEKITITQRDCGYDLWEEATTDAEQRFDANGNPIDTGIQIFIMREGSNEWEDIVTLGADANGLAWHKNEMRYTFSKEFLEKYKPWRVKAEHITTNYNTECRIDVTACIKGTSPYIQSIKNDDQIEFEDISGVIAERSVDGVNWTHIDNSEIDSDGETVNYQEPGLLETTKQIYDQLKDITTEDYPTFPMYRKNAWKTVAVLKKHAESAKEIVKASNDVLQSRGKVVYALTAQEGYHVFSSGALAELKKISGLPKPTRNQMVFYDLLPYGMNFDPSYPVQAGRILATDQQDAYKRSPGLWSTNQIKVDWRTEENYNGTGRTMVTFTVTYTGADASEYVGKWVDSKWQTCYWMSGWGVSFGTYYDWKDASLIKKGVNISAYMAADEAGVLGAGLLGDESDTGLESDGDYESIDPKYQAFERDGVSGGLDGNPDDGDIQNVLYAYNDEIKQIAQYFQSSITKKVRTDYNKYAPFSKSATVEENGYYTYDITVTAGADGLKDVVVFDRLESAGNDSGFPDAKLPEGGRIWQGTLDSVITTGLEQMGVSPLIYYSEDPNAAYPDLSQSPVGSSFVGWQTEAQLKEKYPGDEKEYLKHIKAILLDLRQNMSGGSYELKEEEALTFQVRMKAPELKDIDGGERDAETQDAYAYNGAYYCSSFNNGTQNTWLPGNSTTVSLEKAKALVIEKKFNDNIVTPEAMNKTLFEFTVYDRGMDRAVSYQIYTLQKKVDGVWRTQKNKIYATDDKGRLQLHVDERAVFEKMPGAGNIEVREMDNIFWRWGSEKNDNATITLEDENGGLRETEAISFVITNTFRPVLYVQKITSNVPEEEKDNVKEQEFEFRIQMKQHGSDGDEAEYTAPTGETLTYYYVDRVQINGGTPNLLPGANGEQYKTGQITVKEGDDYGTFKLKGGDVIAIFPETMQTGYRIQEILPEDSDWICTADTMEGEEIPIKGAAAIIQNYYRWRDLYLTKTIEDQELSDIKDLMLEFTFRIGKVKTDGSGEAEWIDANQIDGLQVLKMENGEYVDAGVPVTVNRDGTFTAACAGLVIRIPHLSANETYRIVETDSGEEYLPRQESVDAWMPLYSGNREIGIANIYQRRTLEVKKEVVSKESNVGAEDVFTMIVTVTDEDEKTIQGPFHYYLTKDGRYLDAYEEICFEPYWRQTDEEGRFSLKDGQTAVLKDIGKIGWNYTVDEEDPKEMGYKKLEPADGEKFEGVFSKETLAEKETVINASERDGENLYIKKVYEANADDTVGSMYVDALKYWLRKDDPSQPEDDGSAMTPQEPQDASVEVTLKINGTLFEGPAEVTLLNQLNGKVEEKIWEGDSFRIEPWQLLIMPARFLGDGKISYTVTESKQDSYRLEKYVDGYVEITQRKSPDGSLEVQGVVGQQSVATIVNDVKSYGCSRYAKKYMAQNALEVPVGSTLVWRVERWDGLAWQPAEGISYLTFEGAWTKFQKPTTDGSVNHNLTCDEILRTGPDGCITLTKSGETDEGYEKWPAVAFLQEDRNAKAPKLNFYQGMEIGDLRLVEVMEKSDPAWGVLVGYMNNGKGGMDTAPIPLGSEDNNSDSDTGRPDLDLNDEGGMQFRYGAKAVSTYSSRSNHNDHDENLTVEDSSGNVGFINSNRKSPVEIGKEMEDADSKTFTMILEQVMSLKEYRSYIEREVEDDFGRPVFDENGDPLIEKIPTDPVRESDIQKDDIIATQARANIPYTVYSCDETGKETFQRNGKTGTNGEIYLKAGEYARLELQEGSLWTVSEDTRDKTYQLIDLNGQEKWPDQLSKLDSNLMLINQGNVFSENVCKVTCYESDGSTILYQGTVPYGTDINEIPEPDKIDSQFMGWSFWQNSTQIAQIKYITGDIELYAVYMKLAMWRIEVEFEGIPRDQIPSNFKISWTRTTEYHNQPVSGVLKLSDGSVKEGGTTIYTYQVPYWYASDRGSNYFEIRCNNSGIAGYTTKYASSSGSVNGNVWSFNVSKMASGGSRKLKITYTRKP